MGSQQGGEGRLEAGRQPSKSWSCV